MKRKNFLIKAAGIIVMLLISSCSRNEKVAILENVTTFKVSTTDDVFQWNDFVDSIEIIPLNSDNDDALVGHFYKGFIAQNDIYIFDFIFQTLWNFDISGEFKGKIGQKGQGPGEYLDIRDFCITDSLIYTLDYKKIHRYDRETRKHTGYWNIDISNGFNPVNFLIFDENNYYLWNSNPDVWEQNDMTYYRMRKIKNGKIAAKYFEYDYRAGDDTRFYKYDSQTYYIKPLTAKDTVYKITKDSVIKLYAIDFGDKAVPVSEMFMLKDDDQSVSDFNRSNTFKNIFNIFDVSRYTYFKCIGPVAKLHECIINRETGEFRLGKCDYKNSPYIFFADGNVLYGYYDPAQLIAMKNETNINSCFNIVKDKLPNIKPEDNVVLIKIYLK